MSAPIHEPRARRQEGRAILWSRSLVQRVRGRLADLEPKAPIRILQERLKRGNKILLAGGCGTEITRRGVNTDMPLWSASALLTHPEVVKEIHRDYIDAGADVITTNTFRTNERTFKKAGRSREEARDATLLAVRLAREAREESGRKNVAIGGSVGPVEDCYSPALVPSNEELIREHTTFAEQLKEGGVDFIAIETMNTIREAAIAAEAARKAGLPFTVSFVCDDEGNLLSGEPIEDAVKALVPLGPMALGTNCRPLRKIEKSVDRLLASSPVPVMVYANGGGEPDHATGGWTSEQGDAEGDYVRHTEAWLAKGVKIVGGCCGTTPDYTQRMKKFFPED